ncbi:MAG: hypothetical protein NZ990_02320 [Myxococcota bacterium]|nr:hypothetical protein [Myxococcota bacterium]
MSDRMYPGMRAEERTSFAPYSAFDIPADLRELHGRYDVEATALRVRNFRYAEEWTMMMLGGWVATIPEIPVKTGLGKVIWQTAQAADEFGKRLPELRCGRKALEASEASNSAFADLIQAIAEPESPDLTIEKLSGVFDVLIPHLVEVYELHNRETDPICDAPTIDILADIIRRKREHIQWGQDVLDALCETDALKKRRRERANHIASLLKASGGVTGVLETGQEALN